MNLIRMMIVTLALSVSSVVLADETAPNTPAGDNGAIKAQHEKVVEDRKKLNEDRKELQEDRKELHKMRKERREERRAKRRAAHGAAPTGK